MPILYYFNPGHETAILNESPYYMAPSNVVKMQQDLSYLPAWIGTSQDFVLLENPLPKNFENTLESNNITVSKGITPTLLKDVSDDVQCHIWGMSPQSIHHLKEISSEYSIDINTPEWDTQLKQLSSRQTSLECLTKLCENILQICSSIIPKFYTNLEELEQVVKDSNYQLLAKAPFSSSGRGLLWLPIGELTRTERQIIHGILKKQNTVSLERVLKKKIDFAMEFTVSKQGNVSFEGYSLFNTNEKGCYLGNYIGSQQHIVNTITSYIKTDLLEEVKANLITILRSRFGKIYQGCIGVDMMIYLEGNTYKLHPCLEINVRDNMGFLSIKISENHIHQSSEGSFFIDFYSKEGQLHNNHKDMVEHHPLKLRESKIEEGYLSLCPITESTKYRAYILIKKREENV